VGYSADDGSIAPGTIKENIVFGRELDEHWLQTVISSVGFDLDLSAMPLGLNTVVAPLLRTGRETH
jgi:ABC-type multidrug transport system fused ATPase/permease subunit